ncbi:unnamed protein product [Camellia sinensis]
MLKNGVNSLLIDASEGDDALKASKHTKRSENQNGNQPIRSRQPTINGHRATTKIVKEAKDLKHSADRLKNSGLIVESTGLYFQAALKFLHGASLLESSNGESAKQGEMIRSMQMCSSTAKLCEFCAHEYEKSKDIAAAALAYKCMEVAYMRVIYYSHTNASRDRHELQTALQIVPPGESPSSSASDVDNLNNPTTLDKVPLTKGYITVEESQLFYYFIESEGNPKEDPLLLWYGGGPGCSAFNGLIYEIGPLAFNITEYEGGTPTLEYYPYSWTQWLIDHPKYLKNQLFIGADSNSGITAPIVVQHILEGNAVGERPRLNLKETKITCNANYYDVDPNQAECFESLQKIANLIHDINKNDILEPKCTWASPDQNGETDRRSLEQQSGNLILSPSKIPEMWCHNFNYALSYIWANDESVQQAWYITEGTVKDWKRCNKNLDYTLNVETVLDVHKNLSSYGLQVLVYNGDHDLTVPNTGTQDWIKLLNLTIVSDWRPWLVDGEVGGEQGTHLKSTSVGNVMRCTKDALWMISKISNLTSSVQTQRSGDGEMKKHESCIMPSSEVQGLGMGLPDLRSKKKGKQKVSKESHVSEALDKLREQTREAVRGLESVTGSKPLADDFGKDPMMED